LKERNSAEPPNFEKLPWKERVSLFFFKGRGKRTTRSWTGSVGSTGGAVIRHGLRRSKPDARKFGEAQGKLSSENYT